MNMTLREMGFVITILVIIISSGMMLYDLASAYRAKNEVPKEHISWKIQRFLGGVALLPEASIRRAPYGYMESYLERTFHKLTESAESDLVRVGRTHKTYIRDVNMILPCMHLEKVHGGTTNTTRFNAVFPYDLELDAAREYLSKLSESYNNEHVSTEITSVSWELIPEVFGDKVLVFARLQAAITTFYNN